MTSSAAPFPSAPTGFGFHPTDEELINHFLKLKMIGGCDHEVAIIAEVNVCNSEPWELPGTILTFACVSLFIIFSN